MPPLRGGAFEDLMGLTSPVLWANRVLEESEVLGKVIVSKNGWSS